MILRSLASLFVLAVLALNVALPTHPMTARGKENLVRSDLETRIVIGRGLPELELIGLDGRLYTREDLQGHRVLITFERSVDW
ncbi:MAG: hypothetical protein CL908_16270 [Deltaproteobacteria bacterium]|nr:hypothetical protein [Deltaproteobacteria bacterium]